MGSPAPDQAGADKSEEGPPHLLAGQRVDDGVHGRVEHGQHDEPLGLKQDSALLHLAGHIHKEKDACGPLLHTKQQKLTQNESQT